MVKLIVQYGHPTDPEAFEKYYAETHMPIASKIEGVERVEISKVAGTPDGSEPSQYRMAELYFNSMQDWLFTNRNNPDYERKYKEYRTEMDAFKAKHWSSLDAS